MRGLGSVLAAAFILPGLPLGAQEKPPAPPPRPGEEARIEAAIKKGVASLRSRAGRLHHTQELVLLTLLHSGVRKGDPWFDELLRTVLEEPLQTTYRVSILAMVLERLDRAAYAKKIFQCAQFLVDNQCENGQWAYGQPTSYADLGTLSRDEKPVEPRPAGEKGAAPSGDPDPKSPPGGAPKIRVLKQREGPPSGDNSNSQYAALGLRACHDSGIEFPRPVIEKAARYWRENQSGPSRGMPAGAGVSPGGGAPAAEPRGWSYGPRGNRAYGSMTAGGVAALTILDALLGVDWKKDAAVQAGVRWLSDNFSVTDNPQHGRQHHFYFLYALERAGLLYGVERFGKRDWYREGALYLLDAQGEDGGWGQPVETCFALLFLRRSTRPLVVSRDSRSERPATGPMGGE